MDETGIEIEVSKELLKKHNKKCLAGCIQKNKICLGFVLENEKNLTISDDDTEFYDVPPTKSSTGGI